MTTGPCDKTGVARGAVAQVRLGRDPEHGVCSNHRATAKNGCRHSHGTYKSFVLVLPPISRTWSAGFIKCSYLSDSKWLQISRRRRRVRTDQPKSRQREGYTQCNHREGLDTLRPCHLTANGLWG